MRPAMIIPDEITEIALINSLHPPILRDFKSRSDYIGAPLFKQSPYISISESAIKLNDRITLLPSTLSRIILDNDGTR
jgi:hypothetical protein